MRRIAGIVLAVLLIGGVVAAVVAGRNGQDKGTATKTVRGVIGSEKAEFFADPDVVAALLNPGWVAEVLAQDPEGVHTLSRAVRQDIPEAVDTFVRTRWWTRLTPGSEPPERHLERQLTLLHEESDRLAASLRETEARRQESHTRYLEDRGRS